MMEDEPLEADAGNNDEEDSSEEHSPIEAETPIAEPSITEEIPLNGDSDKDEEELPAENESAEAEEPAEDIKEEPAVDEDDALIDEDSDVEARHSEDSAEKEESTANAPLSPEEERLLKEGIKKDSDGLYVMTGPSEYNSYQALKVEEKISEPAVDKREEIENVVKEPEPVYEEQSKKQSPKDMIEEIEIPELEESEEEKFLNGLSGAVEDIVKVLGSLDGKFVTFLKASDKEMIAYLNSIIESSWKRQQVDHKDKLFSIYDYSMSVLLAETPVRDELRLSELLNNAGAVMYSKDADEWTALILYIDENYKIEDAMETTFTRESFSQSDWKRIVNIGEILKSRSAK